MKTLKKRILQDSKDKKFAKAFKKEKRKVSSCVGQDVEKILFEKAAQPLMRYLAKNHNPHCRVIVTNCSAEIVEGIRVFTSSKYIKD